MPDLDIFATSDLHNRLCDEAAGAIADARALSPNSVLLDCGDAIKAGNLGFSPGGEPILRRMTGLGYACMAVGNREFHPRGGIFRKKVQDAGFDVICTNIARRSQHSRAFLPQSSVVLQAGDMRVAAVGLLVPMVTESMLTSFASEYLFSDPLEAAAAEVERLQNSADMILALCHTSRHQAEEIASQVEGIGAVILGHVHGKGPGLEWVDGIPIIAPAPYAQEMAKLSVAAMGTRLAVKSVDTIPLRARDV